MVKVIGLDIGGANTKVTFLYTKNGHIEKIKAVIKYFPMWTNSEKLASMLSILSEKVSGNVKLDGVGLTMTAELSDVYQTKRQGVNHILDCAVQVFADLPVFVLDVNASLISVEDAKSRPLEVAAANWTATGWLVAQLIKTCVIVDVGSTSTSIIPVINGRVSAAGKTDSEKLLLGELVYTGGLRTNVAAIARSVPLRERLAQVSSELFAQSGDVHLVLGNITEKEYTTETVDGRGKTKREAMARLARVVCADIEMLTEEEIVQIARHIYNKQVEQIIEGLKQVCSRVKSTATAKIPVVVTGLGKDFLAKIAAQKLRVEKIIDLSKLLPSDVVMASPAAGVALMTASKLEGRTSKWMQ